MPSHFQKGVFGLAHISISRGHHRTKSGFDSLNMTSEAASAAFSFCGKEDTWKLPSKEIKKKSRLSSKI